MKINWIAVVREPKAVYANPTLSKLIRLNAYEFFMLIMSFSENPKELKIANWYY